MSHLKMIMLVVVAICVAFTNGLVLVEQTTEFKVFPSMNLTTFTAEVSNMQGKKVADLNGLCQQTRLLPRLELCTYNLFTDKWTVRPKHVFFSFCDLASNNNNCRSFFFCFLPA